MYVSDLKRARRGFEGYDRKRECGIYRSKSLSRGVVMTVCRQCSIVLFLRFFFVSAVCESANRFSSMRLYASITGFSLRAIIFYFLLAFVRLDEFYRSHRERKKENKPKLHYPHAELHITIHDTKKHSLAPSGVTRGCALPLFFLIFFLIFFFTFYTFLIPLPFSFFFPLRCFSFRRFLFL